MHDDSDAFEQIMEKVGYEGRFQRMYSWIYIMGLTFCGALIYMNLILALSVPDHWCHVPGMDKTNFTVETWRTITLPKERDNKGEVKFSNCKMYSTNFTEIQHWDYENWNFSMFEVTECVHGFQYDKQWFERTIVSQEDWVCEKELYVTNVFIAVRITEVVGTFFFGQLGDILGRRAVYYISVISVMTARAISIVTSSSFLWFIIVTAASAFPVSSFFQSAVVIAMEISRDDERTNIAMQQSLGWSIGTCLIPFVFWALRDWVPLMWLTTLPCVFIFFFYKHMIESPRWLISRRRFADAIAQFNRIASINGRKFDMTPEELAEKYSNVTEEKVYGIMSLFIQWRIARNTMIMGFSWCVVSVSYFTLYLLTTRMGGNPFLNFFLQSLVEMPSYFVGKYLGDRIGRRLSTSVSYLVSGIVCLPVICMAPYVEYQIIVISLVTFIKFLNGVTYFVASLQSMEIYPTCLRQTGISLGAILGNAVGVLAPYFVHIGTSIDVRYPYYILAVLFLLGGAATLFLPETLHQKLPDSLDEALNFGTGQKFWSLPKAPEDTGNDDLETTKINLKKYEI